MATDTEPAFQVPVVPEDEFAVYGTVYAFPQHADALEAVYRETTVLSASEPGILYYCISRDGDDPAVFHFFERYTGRAAFDAHNSQPIIQKLLNQDRYIRDVKAVIAKPL
ncbi:putative antibiotic biosynthesis monooxygenase [Podospora conica]|nr:putative antibiotic biosynthesis monooxygenase [Schizothecium conicum]